MPFVMNVVEGVVMSVIVVGSVLWRTLENATHPEPKKHKKDAWFSIILKFNSPFGTKIVIISSTFLLINPFPIGEVIEILFFDKSASSSPTS